MRDFAVEANFPPSKFCWLRPCANNLSPRLVSFWVLHNQGLSARIEELGAATDVLGEAANFGAAFGIETSVSRESSGCLHLAVRERLLVL